MAEGKLSGKIALVSGAGKGIGQACARRCHAEGATVIFTDIDPEAEKTLEGLGERAVFMQLDATSEENWNAVRDAVKERFGRLDVMVNNAGGGTGIGPFESFTSDEYRHCINLNLHSNWLGSRFAVQLMESAGGGSIVNISSIDGLVGVSGMAAYVAAKHGVTGLTKSLALELGGRGIRVNSVHPGFIGSAQVLDAFANRPAVRERLEKAIDGQPIKRLGKPEEIAAAVLFFASDESSFCTGSSLVVDGGHLAGPMRFG